MSRHRPVVVIRRLPAAGMAIPLQMQCVAAFLAANRPVAKEDGVPPRECAEAQGAHEHAGRSRRGGRRSRSRRSKGSRHSRRRRRSRRDGSGGSSS